MQRARRSCVFNNAARGRRIVTSSRQPRRSSSELVRDRTRHRSTLHRNAGLACGLPAGPALRRAVEIRTARRSRGSISTRRLRPRSSGERAGRRHIDRGCGRRDHRATRPSHSPRLYPHPREPTQAESSTSRASAAARRITPVSSGRFRRASSHAARLDQVIGSAKSQSGPLVSSSGTVASARYVILALQVDRLCRVFLAPVDGLPHQCAASPRVKVKRRFCSTHAFGPPRSRSLMTTAKPQMRATGVHRRGRQGMRDA